MEQELRNRIVKYVGVDDDDCIFEFLIDLKTIKEYGHDEHRWYTTYSVVVKIDDNFYVDFQTYRNSGDEPALDSNEYEEMVLTSVCEVFPKEITIIDYVTKDKL